MSRECKVKRKTKKVTFPLKQPGGKQVGKASVPHTVLYGK